MKRWMGVTAAGIVAVSVLGLPPDGLDDVRPWNVRHAQDQLVRELRGEIASLNQVLKRVRVQDSLRVVLAEEQDAVSGVAVRGFAAVDSIVDVGVVKSSIRQDAAALPERADGVLLAAYLVPAWQGDHPSHGGRYGDATLEWYGGELEDGRSYCMVTMAIDPDGRGRYSGLDLPTRGSRLGPCAPWARFGSPGTSVGRWLARGASRFTVGDRLPESARGEIAEYGRRPFGLTLRRPVSAELERCLHGESDACRGLFVLDVAARDESNPYSDAWWESQELRSGPALRETGYVGQLSRWPSTSPMGLPASVLFADLERQFGPERLRAFWTSDEPVEVAFHDAFGTDAATWTREWLSGYYPSIGSGDRALPTRLNTLSVLATIGLAAGIAGLSARRRQVA